LERISNLFSKYALKLLHNQTDFDSAIRRFDPSRASHALRISENFLLLRQKALQIAAFQALQSSLETAVRAITYQKSATVSG
jgi:hypothetical protein